MCVGSARCRRDLTRWLIPQAGLSLLRFRSRGCAGRAGRCSTSRSRTHRRVIPPIRSARWQRDGGTPMTNGSYLTRIDVPPPEAGDQPPHIHMDYSGTGNITDLFDLNGNHWHYDYATSLGTLRVSKVTDPVATANPITIAYASNVDGASTQTD